MAKQVIIAICKAIAVGPSLYLVIPKEIRNQLGIIEGEDFNVYYDPKLGLIYERRKEG